jgi:hypothetical protein
VTYAPALVTLSRSVFAGSSSALSGMAADGNLHGTLFAGLMITPVENLPARVQRALR